MFRKSTVVAFVFLSSSWSAFSAGADSTALGEKERGPQAALKRAWDGTLDGVKTVGNGVTKGVAGIFHWNRTQKSAGLETKIVLVSTPISLARDRQVKASLCVYNNGKRTQLLRFPTTQRADAVIRDQTGNIVGRASEDRQFASEEGVVAVNPGERVEFDISLPTREMVPGKTYVLDAALTNQDGLRAQTSLTVAP